MATVLLRITHVLLGSISAGAAADSGAAAGGTLPAALPAVYAWAPLAVAFSSCLTGAAMGFSSLS